MFGTIILKLSRIPEKIFLAAILANMGLRNSQADLGLDSTQFRVSSHTLFDEIHDSVVNSERGELVWGFDPALVYSAHFTAGDLWRAPIRLLKNTLLVAGM